MEARTENNALRTNGLVLKFDLPLEQPDTRNLAITFDLIVCAFSPRNQNEVAL